MRPAERVYKIVFASVYPMYLAKAKRKGRTKDEVDQLLSEAAAAGGVITKPGEDSPHFTGRTGYFADPDGHLWEVAWNPAFALSEDGSLTLPS